MHHFFIVVQENFHLEFTSWINQKYEKDPEIFDRFFYRCLQHDQDNQFDSSSSSSSDPLVSKREISNRSNDAKKMAVYQKYVCDAGFASAVPDLDLDKLENEMNSFFGKEDHVKHQLIYQALKPNMIVSGHLTKLVHGNWIISIKKFVGQHHPIFSDVHELDLKALCPKKYLSDLTGYLLPEDLRVGLSVKAIIVDIPSNSTDPIIVSFRKKFLKLGWYSRRHVLGYNRTEEEEIGISYGARQSYNNFLHHDGVFSNPASITAICHQLKIENDLSLLHLYNFEGKYLEVLRAKKLSSWALERVQMGENCYNQNEYVKALELYEEAINLDPKCIEPYILSANIYFDMGKPLVACRYADKALELNPKASNAIECSAKIREKLKFTSYDSHSSSLGSTTNTSNYLKTASSKDSIRVTTPSSSIHVPYTYPHTRGQYNEASRSIFDNVEFKRLPHSRFPLKSQSNLSSESTNSGLQASRDQTINNSMPDWVTDLNAMVPDIKKAKYMSLQELDQRSVSGTNKWSNIVIPSTNYGSSLITRNLNNSNLLDRKQRIPCHSGSSNMEQSIETNNRGSERNIYSSNSHRQSAHNNANHPHEYPSNSKKAYSRNRYHYEMHSSDEDHHFKRTEMYNSNRKSRDN